MQALQQQCRTNHQNKAQANLENHQARAHPRCSAGADHTRGLHFQGASKVDVAGLKGRDQSDDKGGDETNTGTERHHTPVDFPRQVHRHSGARREEQHERVSTPVRNQESAGGPER